MTRVGLVLGAGGVVGQAFHAGVLAALEHDYGFDPRAVEVIVGTSAGSITGTLLRFGVSAADLAAWTVKAPLSGEEPLARQLARTPIPDLAPFRLLHAFRRPPQLPGWHMIQRAVQRPWQFRPLAAGLALLAPGRHDIEAQLAALYELENADWPERDLWICTVRRRDGRRVVLGRPGAPHAPVHLAVAASCAVPGYFKPVEIDHRSYVDGGAHSPTNAAILAGSGLDLVIVVSPMSGPPGPRPDLYAASRRHAKRLLRREIRALHAAGVRTLIFEPGPAEQRVMGNDLMSAHRLTEVIQQSFLAAGAKAAAPQLRRVMLAATGAPHERADQVHPQAPVG
jgi:NTE family protein